MLSRLPERVGTLLTFDAGKGDSLDKCALGEEEKRDHRHCEHRRYRHHPSPLDAHGAGKDLDAQGERVFAGIVEVDQRPDKVIPTPQKLKVLSLGAVHMAVMGGLIQPRRCIFPLNS